MHLIMLFQIDRTCWPTFVPHSAAAFFFSVAGILPGHGGHVGTLCTPSKAVDISEGYTLSDSSAKVPRNVCQHATRRQ